MKDIFAFTFVQKARGKGYKFMTFIFPVILMLIVILISAISVNIKSSGTSDESFSGKIYIDNQSDLEYLNFDGFKEAAIVIGKAKEDDKKSVNVTINKDSEAGYMLECSVPAWSEISKDKAEEIVYSLSDYVLILAKTDAAIKNGSDKSPEELFAMFEETQNLKKSEGEDMVVILGELFNMLAPMLIILVMYLMAIFYGQSVSKTVIAEKASKLIETILITVRPAEVIFGKVLAMAVLAILQMCMWILGIGLGLLFGDLFAKTVNPAYNNIIFEVFDLLRENSGNLALSVPMVILAILVMFIGFLFFCFFAGLVSSPVSKAEELPQGLQIYQLCVVLGFLVPYILAIREVSSPLITTILRIIPFSAAFSLPGDILVGNISIAMALVYTCVLILFTVVVAVYSGKLYKSQVFYNDASVNVLKRIFLPLKKK